MAEVHGLPGQFGKQQAARFFDRYLMAALITTTALGVAIGYVLGRLHVWWALIGMGRIALVQWLVMRKLTPHMNSLARERIKYLRGGQAEAFVSYLLQKDLDDSWHIFNGMKLEAASDIDHIAVGPTGIFCISTKSHRGIYSRQPDGTWLRNNAPATEVKSVQRQVMSLRDRLIGIMGSEVPWITPVLAVPLAWVEGDRLSDQVLILHQENLTDRIAPEAATRKLNAQQVNRLVKVLEMLQRDAASVYKRPTVDELPQDVRQSNA